MYAIIARVPINTMFLAGLLPALVMVAFLLVVGGYLKRGKGVAVPPGSGGAARSCGASPAAAWTAKWEILAPVVAIGSLVSGIATPDRKRRAHRRLRPHHAGPGPPGAGLAHAARRWPIAPK